MDPLKGIKSKVINRGIIRIRVVLLMKILTSRFSRDDIHMKNCTKNHLYQKSKSYLRKTKEHHNSKGIVIVSLDQQKNKMSYEAGSTECRGLIEAKESLIKAMGSLGTFKNLDHIQKKLRDIYNDLEQLHESRRIKESNDIN